MRQHHPAKALDLLHDRLLPVAGYGPRFIVDDRSLVAGGPGYLHREQRHLLLLPVLSWRRRCSAPQPRLPIILRDGWPHTPPRSLLGEGDAHPTLLL
jgi:hypothetical protein